MFVQPDAPINSITVVLISRFLIDLQAANRRTVNINRSREEETELDTFVAGSNRTRSATDHSSSHDSCRVATSTLEFASFDVVGSIGATVELTGEDAISE